MKDETRCVALRCYNMTEFRIRLENWQWFSRRFLVQRPLIGDQQISPAPSPHAHIQYGSCTLMLEDKMPPPGESEVLWITAACICFWKMCIHVEDVYFTRSPNPSWKPYSASPHITSLVSLLTESARFQFRFQFWTTLECWCFVLFIVSHSSDTSCWREWQGCHSVVRPEKPVYWARL